MNPGLLTAGNGQSWENELVAALDRPGAAMTVIRRCVDIADVLTAATTGQASVVVLSEGNCGAWTPTRCSGSGRPEWRSSLSIRLGKIAWSAGGSGIGLTHLLADDAGSAALLAAARTAVNEMAGGPSKGLSAHRSLADPRFALPPNGRRMDGAIPGPADDHPAPTGRVIAVWGPVGAPGRSMLATNSAVETAAAGMSTLLIDADVYGGVLASAFGLLDESPGLAGACRMAANGRLGPGELTTLGWQQTTQLTGLLTGIPRPDRWPEVRPSSIPSVLEVCRAMAR